MRIIPQTTKDFGYLMIFDLYSEEELKVIWNEILNLDYIMDRMELGFLEEEKKEVNNLRGKHDDGLSKMSGEGLTLDKIYANRDYSPILTYNRKLFVDEYIVNKITEAHPSNKLYRSVNTDMTIVNRYSNSHQYDSHRDMAAFTGITVLLHKPEKIRGGDFTLPDYDITFEAKNNSCIIFPSWVNHCASSLESDGGRRYSIAQLMYVTPLDPGQLERN